MVLGIPSIGIAKSALIGKKLDYKIGLEELSCDDQDVGFVTTFNDHRFWSPGYSVSLKNLEEIISQYGNTCLEAMKVAHKLANAQL